MYACFLSYRQFKMYQLTEKTDNEHYEDDEILKKKAIDEFTKFIQEHPFITFNGKIGNILNKKSFGYT